MTTKRRRSPADARLIAALRAAGVKELAPGLSWSVPNGRTVTWDGIAYRCSCGWPAHQIEACPHVQAVSEHIRQTVVLASAPQ